MEKDLSTDAVGIPPRLEKEQEDLPQNQSVPELRQYSQATGYPHEKSDSVSDLSDISLNFDPLQIKDKLDSRTDMTIKLSDPGPTGRDNPDAMLEESNADNVAELASDHLNPVPGVKQKSDEDRQPNKSNISDGKDHLSNTNSVLTRRQINFPPKPPLEWRLNGLLDEIAISIEPTEFSRIKLMFTGPEGIGKKVLEQCDTCLKLFTVLKERGYISRDNLLYLNKILYILERQDLITRAAQYCRDEGDVIHFYSVEGKPDTGSRNIKIHVVADVSNCDQETIDRLRNIVASIVCAPPEVVIISAVEPGSSFLVTLTMPVLYVDILKQLLEEKVPLRRLAAVEADKIIIDDVSYVVSGQCAEMCVTEQSKEIMNVFEQLEDKRMELEQMDIAGMKCREEMNNVKTQLEKAEAKVKTVDYLERVNHELSTTCTMLQSMHLTSEITETALGNFQLLMKEATNKGQDMDLVKEIVKSNTEIAAAYHRYANETEREKQRIKFKERKIKDIMLRQELLCNLKSAEEILTIKYNNTLDTNVTLNLEFAKTLNGISEKLTGKERSILMSKFTWSKDDVIKACIDADERLLLLGLECKETERTQERIDREKFLQVYGREVGRDLPRMYIELAEQQKKVKIETERKKLNVQLIQQLKTKAKSPEDIIRFYSENLVAFANVGGNVLSVDCKASAVEPLILTRKGLMHFLNDEEIIRLTNICIWHEEDAIQACIKEDKSLLFPGLMCKELERLDKFITPGELIWDLQMKIKRRDLFGLFIQLKNNVTELQKQIKTWQERKLKESQLFDRLKAGKTSAEDALFQKFTNYTLKLAEEIEVTSDFEKLAKLLCDLSEQFTREEIVRLVGRYQWSETDVVKACINADRKLLIQGLWCKEIDITQLIPKIDQFVSTILREINRMDLLDKFKEKRKLLMIDEKMVHHMVDMTAEYISSSQKIQGYKQNQQNLHNEAGATSVQETSDLMYTTTAAAVGHLPGNVM